VWVSVVRRFPVISFYILAWSLGAGFLYLVAGGALPSSVAMGSVLSASIAAVIVTAAEDGRAGLNWIFSRLLKWRAGIGYWILAMVFPIPVFLAGSMLNGLFGGQPIDFSRLEPAFPIVPMLLMFFIVAGLGQELGWTGFLLPRLQSRYDALTSSIVRALLVAFWHLPLLLYSRLQHPAVAGFPYSGWIAQRGFLVTLAVQLLMFAIPWSIFFSWIFNNTEGSLLLTALLHGSEIWVAYLLASFGIRPDNLDNYWGYGLVLVVAAILLVIWTGPQDLSRKGKRIVHQPPDQRRW
jgi:membrane protease YdiL (CAAX protease family)